MFKTIGIGSTLVVVFICGVLVGVIGTAVFIKLAIGVFGG